MSTDREEGDDGGADWRRRVVDRSLRSATQRSIDRGSILVRAAGVLLEQSEGDDFTVQDVADEARQSLRTLYQYFASKDDLLLAVFEEAMRAYASLIHDSIASIEEPLSRLAGALLAAIRLPAGTSTGTNRSLTRVRLRLSQVEPAAVGRAQEPVAALFRRLLRDASADGSVAIDDLDAATFLLLSLNATSITTHTLGNDQGAAAPEPRQIVEFCLRGLGARPGPGWLDAIDGQLRLPRGRTSVVAMFTADPASSARP